MCRGCTDFEKLGWLAYRLYGRTVDQELSPGDDDSISRFQAILDGIVVPDGVAESDRALLGDGTLVGLGCHINKRLPTDTCDCQDRNRRGGSGAPDHPRLDQLRVPKRVQRFMERRLQQ